MQEKKISINIFYNILNQIVSFIVPLILSPYVARVLSAELIGDYSYALANSSYFVLIEALGFSLYGMLKVSANRADKKYISTLFKEIMIAKFFLMVTCIIVYTISFVWTSSGNKILCAIMIMNIISTGIDSTWFLMGMEDFKTTALRNIAVRLVNIVLIIILVKSEKDFLIYAIIMQLSNVISYIVVFPTVKKYIISSKVSFKNILKHTIKSLIYFVPGIVNTIFTSADKTVLGAFANSYEVGVYEQASKICSLCGSVINSISNVVMPRVTYLNHNASNEKSKKFMFKTLHYASVVAIVVTVGIICISDEFVPLFFGLGYEKSAVLLKILAFNVLMSILANYIGQQCLISNDKQNQYNIAISVGAILNVILNLFMVERLQSVGVSVASVVSSGALFLVVLIFSREIISLKNIIQMDWKAIISAIIMFVTIYWLSFDNLFITLVVKVVVGAAVYISILAILREEIIQEVFSNIIRQ
jgi:O-antigen/teichoic acid export membrane protein